MDDICVERKHWSVGSSDFRVVIVHLCRHRSDQSSHWLALQVHSDSNHFSCATAVVAVKLLWQNEWRSLGEPTTDEVSAQQFDSATERR